MTTSEENRMPKLTPEEAQLHDRLLRETIEPNRIIHRITVRDAAYRAGMSEGNWRQLVVTRPPTRIQLLDMARAVGVLDQVAEQLGAGASEVEASTVRLGHVMDLAERELMHMRHLTHDEKHHLWEALNQYREEHKQ